MSYSSLFYFVSCYAFYKLGAFNARYPEFMREKAILIWNWVIK